jgi:hypothetical protein
MKKISTALVALVVLSLGAFGASTAAAAPPPPPVVPHPPPIAATFTLHPDSGPVGTQVTIKGVCGYAASELLYAVRVQTADGFTTIWLPPEFANLKLTPLGAFSVTFTFPSAGNIAIEDGGLGNVPIVPGTYYVAAACNIPQVVQMPPEPFTVTAPQRG